MADGMQRDWHELCVLIVKESAATKRSSPVQELIGALDQGELIRESRSKNSKREWMPEEISR